MVDPGKGHWEAVTCILRYIKGSPNVGLVYGKGSPKGDAVVEHVTQIRLKT